MSTDQNPAGIAGVIAPPPLIYAVPLIAGLLIQRWQPIQLLAPRLAMPVGVVVIALGFIALAAMMSFRRAETPPQPWKPTKALVTSGPYRLTRNPMYLGFTLVYIGVSAWVNTAWPLFFLPLILIAMQFGVILREEAYLERLFGDEYRAYRQRVRRWI